MQTMTVFGIGAIVLFAFGSGGYLIWAGWYDGEPFAWFLAIPCLIIGIAALLGLLGSFGIVP